MINKKAIEIDITLRCNLNCPNCDRMAPKDLDLSLENIQKFVDTDRVWQKIVLIGGEPTLHPQLEEIFKIIEPCRYLRYYQPRCIIAIATNGYDKELLKRIPKWVYILSSGKKSSKQLFKTFNVAPIDVGITTGFEKGCYIADHGVSLSVDGLYYPCGAGATVAREFGFKIGQESVETVDTWMFEKLCRYCGHFKYDKSYISTEEYEKECVTEQVYSKSWLERNEK